MLSENIENILKDVNNALVPQLGQRSGLRSRALEVQILSSVPNYVESSAIGRAPHCDCGGYGFKSRLSTQLIPEMTRGTI